MIIILMVILKKVTHDSLTFWLISTLVYVNVRIKLIIMYVSYLVKTYFVI
jgi:hypothetical protein